MSETYTIRHTDPKHLEATFRGRKYQLSVRTGDVFTIVPDNPASLPICKLEMKMQRGFFNKHFGGTTPVPAPVKASRPAKTTSTEE